ARGDRHVDTIDSFDVQTTLCGIDRRPACHLERY
ncbi:MAG: hypothetical protein V7642_4753, partial [Burkholderiales bacterium]